MKSAIFSAAMQLFLHIPGCRLAVWPRILQISASIIWNQASSLLKLTDSKVEVPIVDTLSTMVPYLNHTNYLYLVRSSNYFWAQRHYDHMNQSISNFYRNVQSHEHHWTLPSHIGPPKVDSSHRWHTVYFNQPATYLVHGFMNQCRNWVH